MRKNTAIFILVLLAAGLSHSSAAPQETLYWMRLSATNVKERTEIASQVSIESVNETDVVAVGSADDLAQLQKENRVLSYYEVPVNSLDFPKDDEKFHNYAELTKAMTELALKYPQWVDLSSIGKTVEKSRYLYAYARRESHKPVSARHTICGRPPRARTYLGRDSVYDRS